jgi:hypothetical protein
MGKIPEIDSIEELAEFWGTHDITDFEEVCELVFDWDADATNPHGQDARATSHTLSNSP